MPSFTCPPAGSATAAPARARLARGLLAVVVATLAGCAAGPVRHEVTVFHEWPANLAERTFVIARMPEQPDSLEYRTYERIVREELRAAGFVESDEPSLQIAFDYGADRRTIRYVDRDPLFTPYVSLGHYRRWGGFGISGPLWWGGYSTTVREVDAFERHLELEISDLRTDPPQRIYEADASSRGSDPALAAALPLLMKAVLADFPGRSGIARSVDVLPPDSTGADSNASVVAPASAGGAPVDAQAEEKPTPEEAPAGVPRVR